MLEWIKVAEAKEVAPACGKVVTVLGETVVLFAVDGDVCAIDNTCPHQGGPLGEGVLDGDVVTCPWHGWRYNVRTGCPVLTPPVKTFDVRRNGSSIELGVSLEERERYDRALAERDVAGEPATIHAIIEQIQHARTLDEVVDNVYLRLQDILPHNRLGIALIDESSKTLVQVKTRSDRRVLLNDGFSAVIAGSSLERILELGEARIIDDLQDLYASRSSKWTKLILDEGMRSSLTLPLKVEGRAIGVVFFTSISVRAFNESHVGLLKTIAGQLSILIEKGRWISELAQSNERYRTLFEMSNEGMFLCASVSAAFMSVNDNLCRWLGYKYDELLCLSLTDLLKADRLTELQSLLEHDGGRNTHVTLEAELFKDIGTVPVEMRIGWVARGDQRFLQGFVRDLSELRELNAQLRRQYSFEGLIGKSPGMQDVYDLIREVAPLTTTVLLQGESGTGKELAARAIHQNSTRRRRPFVAVNCGALVESLLESELFGHVRGAFSGATHTRQGRFEIANGGTVFLDEIAELSLATQVKLLRVLQEGQFEKVGSTSTQTVDVRIVAATNKDLKAAMRAGHFREDLYYRLNVVPILIPPLRERRQDIPLLVEHFIRKFNRQMGRSIEDVSRDVMAILMEHRFPGNVRELENIVEFAFVKCQVHRIERRHLPHDLTGSTRDVVAAALTAKDPLKALQRELIRRIMHECNGDPRVAAEKLGISRTTLWRKLRDGAEAGP